MKKFLLLLLCFIVFAGYSIQAQNCTVNSGSSGIVCFGKEIILQGGVSGNLKNPPAPVIWSIVSMPAGATNTISNPNSLYTSAGIATVAGSYTFRISTVCADNIPTTQDVTYTVPADIAQPTITAVSAISCFSGTGVPTFNLSASPTPGSGLSAIWTDVTGFSTNFGTPLSNVTTYTPTSVRTDLCSPNYSSDVTYTIQDANGCAKSAVTTVSFTRATPISATADPLQVCGNATNLLGSCPGSGSGSWSFVSGPSTPTISPVPGQNALASGLIPTPVGNPYIFRYTVTGGCNPGTVDVQVTVKTGTAVTQANAGPDQKYCAIPGTVTLSGNVPAVGETATWVQTRGPAVTIVNPNSPVTIATGLQDGYLYTFEYKIEKDCWSHDYVNISKIPNLNWIPIVDCGSTNSLRLSNPVYGGLDTIKITVKILSSPGGGSSAVSFSRNLPNGAWLVPMGYTDNTVYLGQWAGPVTFIYPPNVLQQGINNPENSLFNYVLSFQSFANPGVVSAAVTINSGCRVYDTIITFRKDGNFAISPNAGTDQILACGATQTNLIGNNLFGGSYWETLSMPSGATDPLTTANSRQTSPLINNLIPGTYVFRYSGNNTNSCYIPTAYDYVTVVVANTAPAAPTANNPRTVCAGAITLTATPPPGTLGTWTQFDGISGPVIQTPNSPTTLVTGLTGSSTGEFYTFRYTVTNGCGSAYVDVPLIVRTGSVAPPTISAAGGNCLVAGSGSGTYSLTVNHTDISTYPATTVYNWYVNVSPGTVTYTTTPAATSTTFTFSSNIQAGAMIKIALKVGLPSPCGQLLMTDTLVRFISPFNNGTFQSPFPDKFFCNTSTYPVEVPYTGVNLGGLPVRWSAVNTSVNPSISAEFVPNNSNVTTAKFYSPGHYNIIYEVDPMASACSTLRVFQRGLVVIGSEVTQAIAGDDVSYCNESGTTNLAANTITGGHGVWSIEEVVYGSVPVLGNVYSPTSSITFASSGKVVLRWSAKGTEAECGPSSSDLVTVTYNAPARAGNDQTFCKGIATTLNAQNPAPASGQWTQVSGPNTATIANPNNYQTAVSGLVPGSYTFRFSVSGIAGCTSFDDIVVTVDNITVQANAGPDFTSCIGGTNVTQLNATAAPSGYTGKWTLVSKPASAPAGSFSNVNDPQAKYNGMTVAGTYAFAWTITDGSTCSSTDYVDVTTNTTACVLPITLKSFSVIQENGCAVLLKWHSATEENALGYIVEESEDGISFRKVQEVQARGSNNEYSLKLTERFGLKYYRLRLLDIDGKFSFSTVAPVRVKCDRSGLVVYNNPVTSGKGFKVRADVNVDFPYAWLKIYNSNGGLLIDYPVVLHKGSNTIDFPSLRLASGMYTIILRSKVANEAKASFIVQ